MTRKNKMKLIRDITNSLEAEKIYHNIYLSEEGYIAVDISWGDWKHDHAYIKYIFATKFNLECIGTEVTESDGSDCFSATHFFKEQ